ncbi:IPT/TIG domain-containing protein [Burkholderia sp. Ac-20353]|uniref:beta strand repeat-containing protein n=1 Tax=Burkholderia sp. Ac-20353 TaxID=2703894 RepID=UPI001F11F6BC|nr:IPT/TIG domain-containing protein [Burkholderia sp. Ac-20353]
MLPLTFFAAVTLCWAGTYNLSYDELGRLTGVVDSSGNAATYNYDATGNIVSIARGNAAVSIVGFTPSSGAVGTNVTISGYGFSTTASQNAVSFNGVAATVTSASTTQLVAQVPAGATTGQISITTPSGSASSASAFTVTSALAPTISGFSPLIGNRGTSVTVTGTNFRTTTSEDRLSFNTDPAFVSSASTTSLTGTVSTLATSGRVALTTPYGQATSTQDFFVAPSPYLASAVAVTGRMLIGASQTVTLPATGTIGLILFDGTAGQGVSLLVSSSTFGQCGNGVLQILTPNGSVLGGTALCSGNFSGHEFTLPVTGTYTILVAPNSATGSATFTLNNVPPDPTATITPGGSPVTLTSTTPGQDLILTFSGTAAQRVSLTISENTSLASTWDTITIVNPDGSKLVNGARFSGSYYSDALTLPATGTYTIKLAPDSTATGAATFTLYNVPPDPTGTITPGGSPVTLTTTTPGQDLSLTFSGTAAQRVSLTTSENTSLASTCGTITIVNPDGSSLTSSRMCSTYYSDALTLPATGTYTIKLDPDNTATGSATFTLYNVPPDPTATITAGGPAVTLTTTTPGQDLIPTFSGTAGQRVTVTISENASLSSTCGTITIINPDGSSLTSSRMCSTYYSDALTLPSTGTYTIKLDPDSTVTGSATFTLANVPPDPTGTISPGGSAVTLTNTTPGQDLSLTFSGTAAQRVSLTISENASLSSTCGTVTIVNPNGTSLTSSRMCSTYYSDALTLPATGTYTIKLDPDNTATGSATFTLYNVPSDPTATLTQDGSAVTLTTTTPGQDLIPTFSGTAAQRVTVTISENASLASTCGTVTIINPDGSSLTSSRMCSTYYSDALTLPATGTYTVKLDPDSTVTGSATFTLGNVPPDPTGTITPGGSAVTLTTTTPGQDLSLTFSGTAAQRVSLTISENTSLASTCGTVTIVNPNGSSLNSSRLCGSYSSGTLTLPTTGTYTIKLDPDSTVTGSATFTLTSQ